MDALLADLQANILIYLSMPLIAAAIGYITKFVAVEMMFRPLEFRGIPPFLGWQGVIPRFAPRMASIAIESLMTRLINPQELIDKIDPDELTKRVEKPMLELIEKLARETLAKHHPDLWEALPGTARRLLLRRLEAEAPRVVRRMMNDLRTDVENVIDLRHMAIQALIRDKALLNTLMRNLGKNELRFIVRSGPVFGFVMGLGQVAAWALTHSPWIMPAFGGLTGLLTDWLALYMIFRPQQPKRYFGLITWQGLFHKRRLEVERDYATLIADEILTPANLIEALFTGPRSDQLLTLVSRELENTIDAQSGVVKPLVVMAIGGRRYQEMKQDAIRMAQEHLPVAATHAQDYAMEALQLRELLIEKMRMMSTDEYESLLRPAFKADEPKLIAVGAILGFLIGELQVLLLLH